jgi:hypothetical protein
MSFTVDVVSDVSNIISIDTSVSDTIETVIQDPVTILKLWR